MSGDQKTCVCDPLGVCEDCYPKAKIDPDDTAAPDFPPYTYGERRRNPYYTAQRDIWRYKDGKPIELMISKHADVTDILQAYDVDYQLAEVIAKILRLGRKEGTNRRQEYTKMHEHIQAAEDAWVAEEKE